ncbi:MAG: helix-turn-helix domain-containing protein [Dehalococcoidales bacterium]
MKQDTLLSIGEASHNLGVSEATLRQWTDEGKIKAFVTPGGHRRYSGAELKKFIGAHSRMLGVKDLVVEIEETKPQHREIARSSGATTSWYDRLTKESRQYLAEIGRDLLNIIVKYITEPSQREANLEAARNIGSDYGETLARLELTLTDAVGAYITHRDPITQATTQIMKKKEAFTGRVVEAIPLVAKIMDEVLVSLVAAHQQHSILQEKNVEDEVS